MARIIPFPAVVGINVALARLFGAEVVGQVTLLLFFSGLLAYVSRLTGGAGLAHALTAYPPDSSRGWSLFWKTYRTSIWMMALSSAVLIPMSAIVLDRAYGQGSLWKALIPLVLAAAFLEHSWQFAQCRFRATQRMKFFFRAETAAQYLTLGFVFALPWLLGRSAQSAAMYKVFFPFCAFIGGGIFVWLEYRRRTTEAGGSIPSSRSVISYNARALPQQLSEIVIEYADRLIIPLLLTVEQLGYYASAYSVFKVFDMITRLPAQMLFSSLSGLWHRGESHQVLKTYRDTHRYLVLLGWPIMLAGIGFSDVIMGWFGDDFRQATPALRILLAGCLLHSVAQLTGNILLATNRPFQASIPIGVGSLLNVGLNLLLIPVWGLSGSAAAGLISYALMAVLTLILVARAIRTRAWELLDGVNISRILVAGIPMTAGLGLSLSQAEPLWRFGGALASLALFLALAFMTKAWTRDLLRSVKNLGRA
ncbi:MAG: polysaccharide biosynthesis C-terminal domain-containing protein [Nitrospirae bacterium]|nr:polysaccharide biosynthesis C-terminal domain-containing protein [Nitrospirota bacterium]